MKNSVNHNHYNVDNLPVEIQTLVNTDRIVEPTFVGQGCRESVGSDLYGFYIITMSTLKNGKPLIGIAQAKTVMHSDFADGSEDCSIDMNTAKPDRWVTTRGFDPRTCCPQWWYCDENGVRFKQQKSKLSWNGAYAWRSPSF